MALNNPVRLKLNILGKIWLSAAILVLGYLLSILFSYYQGTKVVARTTLASETIHPASQRSLAAETGIKRLVEEFKDFYLTADQEMLELAKAEEKSIRGHLSALMVIPKLDKAITHQARQILGPLQTYTKLGLRLYPAIVKYDNADELPKELSNGQDHLNNLRITLTRKAARLTRTTIAELKANLAMVSKITDQQHFYNNLLFFLVLTISLIATTLMVRRLITRPLARVVWMIDELSKRNFTNRLHMQADDEIGKMARAMDQSAQILQESEEELRLHRVHLEELVAARTKELEKTQSRLLDASHRAGMAEVATDVLHNVGNVLTTVNVSASLVRENLMKSKTDGLGKAVALVISHQADLATFFGTNPKGKQVIDYLNQLSFALDLEIENNLAETHHLIEKIDHINTIVAMQQSLVGAQGVSEKVPAEELIDEALHINSHKIAKHDISIKKELEELPAVTVNHQKIRQVLVNLVSNACNALEDIAHDRLLTIRLKRTEPNRFAVEIIDNGCGIPKENMDLIYQYGFTTRTEGHGFGLHSCSNTAKEMGGTLVAISDGPNQGSTFILDLPDTIS